MPASRDEPDRFEMDDPQRVIGEIAVQRLAHYELKKRIGSGGMGTVFLAFDTRLKRTLALKVLPREKAQNPTLVRRFKSEASKAAQLEHENIVSVYDAGEADGLCYIAMEYVDGIDVHDLVKRRGVIPVKRSIDIVKQTAKALQHAYAKGIVHRDVKPSNLLIRRDGAVKLADMGLARSIDENTETAITRAGTTVGTVDYMAPEQARDSKAADVRSDIYSLGCTWYHMLTTEPPFPEGSLTNKLRSHAYSPAPDPRLKNPQVPEALLAVLNRMMAKDPDDRYQTPQELLADLENTSLNSDAVSVKILEALVYEEKGGNTAPPAPSHHSGPRALPPKSRVEPSNPEAEVRQPWLPQIQPRFLVYAGVVVAAVFAIIKLTNMAQQYAGFEGAMAINSINVDGGAEAHDGARHAESTDEDADEREPEPKAKNKEKEVERPPEPPPPPADIKQLPAWVDQSIATSNLMEVVVRGDQEGTSPSSTLDEAIYKLPTSGGVIQLVGTGPFVLRPIRSNKKLVLVRAAEGSRPLVALRPPESGGADTILHQVGGTLRLEGLGLVANAAQFPAESPLEIVRVSGGNLQIRDCSISLRGMRAGRTVAMHVDGQAQRSASGAPLMSRILVDRCVARGNGLEGLELDAECVDLVVRDSLFATGNGASLRLHGPYQAAEGSSRLLRFLSSTLSAERDALRLVATSSDDPVATSIWFSNSLVAAMGANPTSELISLQNWPREDSDSGPLLRNLKVQSRNSFFMGWKFLMGIDRDPSLSVDKFEGLPRSWKDETSAATFVGTSWPLGTLENLAEQPLARWAPETASLAPGDNGAPAGCNINQLYRPELPPMTSTLIRPPRPALPEPFNRLKTIPVDLNKQDLGLFISKDDWKDGTTFVASGFGTRTTTPIDNRGRTCQIVFEQAEGGTPLIITPRASDAPGKAASPNDKESALFSVTGGSVEIVNGTFYFPGADKSGAGPNFLMAAGGSFQLKKCRIQSASFAGSPGQELIRWSPPDATAAGSASAGGYSSYGVIEDSFLVGSGTLLAAQLRSNALILRNSVLVSNEDLFGFELGPPIPHHDAAVDADRCTFSARRTFFRIRTPLSEGQAPAGMAIFANDCIFAPPLKEGSGRVAPTLLTYNGKLLEQKKIDWWESGCGYAPDIVSFLRRESDPIGETQQDFERIWKGHWGGPHIRNPLTAAGGVMLKDPLPQRPPLKPANFELHAKSKAIAWAEGGGSIGADVSALEAAKSKPASSTQKPKKASTSKRPRAPGPAGPPGL